MNALAMSLCSCWILACSSSSSGPASTGNAQVRSTFGAKSFVPADAISYGHEILLTDYAGACAEAKSAATKPGAATVSILLPGAVAGTSYSVDAVRAESGTVVSFDTYNQDCTSTTPNGNATAGHVTITAPNGSSLRGTFSPAVS
jgi:hypothetical protein